MSEDGRHCEEVLGRLIATLCHGGDVTAEDRQHVAACPECNRVLAAAGQLEDALEADVAESGSEERISRATREAQAALAAERWRRAQFTVLGACAALIPWLMVPKVAWLQVFGLLVALGAVGTLLVRRLNAGSRGVVLYKRLKRQWFFGVCRGLAEASGLPVGVFRACIIALMLVGKTGFLIAISLYLLFEMSLEVHPEDRAMLLRFRLKRWLDRFSGAHSLGRHHDQTASS